MWQLKSVHRQKSGQFWVWRQTDRQIPRGAWGPANRWAWLVFRVNQGQWYDAAARYDWERGRSGMTGINSQWLKQFTRSLQGVKYLNVSWRLVFGGTPSSVTYTEETLMITSSTNSWKMIFFFSSQIAGSWWSEAVKMGLGCECSECTHTTCQHFYDVPLSKQMCLHGWQRNLYKQHLRQCSILSILLVWRRPVTASSDRDTLHPNIHSLLPLWWVNTSQFIDT